MRVEDGGRAREEDGSGQEHVFGAGNAGVGGAALGVGEDARESVQAGADLVGGGGVVRGVGGAGDALDEAFEDGEGQRDDGGLAGACAEDRGEDVQDAGV